MLEICIPMRPVPKARPRFSGGHCYTPPRTKLAEDAIAWAVKAHMQKEGIDIATGPILLMLWFSFKMPAKLTKPQYDKVKDKLFHHIKRPDLDNLVKTVMDSLNKVAYEDDSQIAHIDSCKLFGEEDSIRIQIVKLDV